MVRPVMQCVGVELAVMLEIAADVVVADNCELWMIVMVLL